MGWENLLCHIWAHQLESAHFFQVNGRCCFRLVIQKALREVRQRRRSARVEQLRSGQTAVNMPVDDTIGALALIGMMLLYLCMVTACPPPCY